MPASASREPYMDVEVDLFPQSRSGISAASPSRASNWVLGLGFSLTGAGTIMLGVLLPVLSRNWGLRDDQAGLLFFLQFLGSTFGAIVTRSDRIRSMAIGYGLLVAAACALAFVGPHSAYPVFFLLGWGLGMAMTSTNLLISDRNASDRAAWLERFNFAWSCGAMIAPLLFVPFLRGASLRLLYFPLAAAFLLMFLWVIFRERRVPRDARAPLVSRPRRSAVLGSLLPLLVLCVCSIGVETALSGWLTTYSHRASPLELGGGAFATALFMLGMVSSRFITSTSLLARVGRQRALRIALWGTAITVVFLIAGHHSLAIDTASVLAGLCIGPLFPLLLSFILERSPNGWVFAVAGTGSFLFPWLTGLLSSQFGSLRYGLLAPCAAALLMIVLSAISFETETLRTHALPAERA